MAFFEDLFGLDDEFNRRERLEHAYGHEDEIDFKPKKKVVTRNVAAEAKKHQMVQLHPPIDKVHLKNDGDVITCASDTKIEVGSSEINVKEVTEEKETTGEHLYKAEVTKDDDIVGQAVIYAKETDPILVSDDAPVIAKKKSFCKTPYFMDEAMYKQRVRELAGGKANLSDDDDGEGGFNILDLETPLGDLDLNTGESYEIIDFNTPIVRTRVGDRKNHLLAVDTPIAGVQAGGSIVGVDTPIVDTHVGTDRGDVFGLNTPIGGVQAGGPMVGVDTPIAETHVGTDRGNVFGLNTPIGGVQAGGSLVGVETPIMAMHAGCHKCKSTTRAECRCPSKSAYGKKHYGKVYSGAKYDNMSNERRRFLQELHEIDEKATYKMVEIAQKPTTEREKRMLDIYGDIITLVHDTMVIVNGLEESRVANEEERFKRRLAQLNHDLKEASNQDHHIHGLTHKKTEIIDKSVRFQQTYEEEVAVDMESIGNREKMQQASDLLKRISSQFERFRNDIKNARSEEELQRIERQQYFGERGSITKLKKKLDNLIVS
jgi:hypothetical protein